ncbi:MAG: GDSL-type esterase/lipase family protein [Prevotellaceae bacterium]|jgi:lysophospholipase L1-like esterase|nr:GDSL-type esterase/lipase family protein [Prevotellaceae bacterium]
MRNTFPTLLLFICLVSLAMPSPAQEHWRKDMEAFRRLDAANPPAQGEILFVGSSTFNLWRDYAAYFPGYTIANRGFGGSSLRDVLYFYETLVKPHAPRQIVVYEGDNDLNNDRYTVAQFMDDVACFVHLTQICYPDCMVCFVSIKPSPARRTMYAKYEEANRQLRNFCEQAGENIQYIDIWSLMVDADGEPNDATNYFLDDRLHLNAAGYALLAAAITPYLTTD